MRVLEHWTVVIDILHSDGHRSSGTRTPRVTITINHIGLAEHYCNIHTSTYSYMYTTFAIGKLFGKNVGTVLLYILKNSANSSLNKHGTYETIANFLSAT